MDIKLSQAQALSNPSYEVVFVNDPSMVQCSSAGTVDAGRNLNVVSSMIGQELTYEEQERIFRIEETIDEVIAQATVGTPTSDNYPVYTTMPAASSRISVNNHHQFFEDLPDNFLENVGPPDNSSTADGPTLTNLTNLTPVSLMDVVGSTSGPTETHGSLIQQGFTSLTPMAVMSNSPSGSSTTQHVQFVSSPGGNHQYMIGTLKLEPPDPAPSGIVVGGGAGISSQSQGSSTTTDVLNLPPVLVSQNGTLHYVKVEVAQDSLGQLNNDQRNLRISTADLANNMLATISGQSQPQTVVIDPAPTSTTVNSINHAPAPVSSYKTLQPPANQGSLSKQLTELSSHVTLKQTNPRPRQSKLPNKESEEGSEGEGDDIYIDTKELCKRIAYELKQHSIPQAIFAERVLCRSQGTLSDLLRNPKPWNKLKSGRETFRRMYGWLKQPIGERLTALELWKVASAANNQSKQPEQDRDSMPVYYSLNQGQSSMESSNQRNLNQTLDSSAMDQSDRDLLASPDNISQSGTNGDQLLAHSSLANDHLESTNDGSGMISVGDVNEEFTEMKPAWETGGWQRKDILPSVEGSGATNEEHRERHDGAKRPRLVFTDIQKRTLQAIFKETQRPSKEMQQTIAEHLGLDLSTVQNFFMNARRRSRLAPIADGPGPNQLVRPITPPPVSPPPGHMTFASAMGGGRSGSARKKLANPEHIATIEDTVEAVASTPKERLGAVPMEPLEEQFTVGTHRVITLDPGAPTPPAIQGLGGVYGLNDSGFKNELPQMVFRKIEDERIVVTATTANQNAPLTTKQAISVLGQRTLPVMSLSPAKRTPTTTQSLAFGGPPKKRLLLAAQRAARSEIEAESATKSDVIGRQLEETPVVVANIEIN